MEGTFVLFPSELGWEGKRETPKQALPICCGGRPGPFPAASPGPQGPLASDFSGTLGGWRQGRSLDQCSEAAGPGAAEPGRDSAPPLGSMRPWGTDRGWASGCGPRALPLLETRLSPGTSPRVTRQHGPFTSGHSFLYHVVGRKNLLPCLWLSYRT